MNEETAREELKRLRRRAEEERIERLFMSLFMIALFLIGYGLLIWIDWRLAVAVFVLQWAQNADNSLRRR